MRITVVQNSKSVRASGLPEVTHVFHDHFCVKAYQDFFSGLICREVFGNRTDRKL
jgi:hypothetical protein